MLHLFCEHINNTKFDNASFKNIYLGLLTTETNLIKWRPPEHCEGEAVYQRETEINIRIFEHFKSTAFHLEILLAERLDCG